VKSKPQFLTLTDFRKKQPKHGERNFPWIRHYSADLDDLTLRSLTKSQRADYYDLCLLANRENNWIKDDPDVLQRHLRLNEPLEVQALIDAGLLCRQRAGRKRASLRPHVGPGKERLGQGRKVKVSGAPTRLAAAMPKLPYETVGVFATLPLNDGRGHPLTEKYVECFETQFPGVDIRGELTALADKIESGTLEPVDPGKIESCIRGWLQKAKRSR
jgi:hypothetical protein